MSDIITMPIDTLFREKSSRKKRILHEVMQKLWRMLPDKTLWHEKDSCFELESGHKCWLRQFSEPKKDDDGELWYGFDVIIEDGAGIDHLEFCVKCSGFGGSV